MKLLPPKLWNVPTLAGLAVTLFGTVMVAQWWLRIPALAADPQFGKIGLNSPLMFVTGGLALLGRSLQKHTSERSWLADIGSIILIIYPALGLSQTLFNIHLGLDLVRVPTPPTPGNPHPGRMSPNASLAFITAGVALWMLRGDLAAYRHRLIAGLAAGFLTGVAALGATGHLLHLDQLYRVASFNSFLLPTSLGLSVLGIGTWWLVNSLGAHHADQRPQTLERRIGYRAAVTLTLVAVAAGIAGFAVLRNTYEASVMTDARETARTNALALSHTVQTALWFPKTVATRPTVIQVFAKLTKNLKDPEAADLLPKLARSFLTANIDGVRFVSTDGRVLIEAGELRGDVPRTTNLLRTQGVHAELRWRDGYLLRATANVEDAGVLLGTVVTEQRLLLFDQVLQVLRQGNDTSDALICSRDGDHALCAPSRIYGDPFVIPMYDAVGNPAYPISRALLGEAGSLAVNDLRQVPVIAGFTPIGDLGLGLVVKTDVSTLYAPLRESLRLLGLLVIALVAMGMWALRVRVKPLVQAVVAEQQRTRTILDTSSDAFIAIDIRGDVSDWNKEATRLFGWEEKEAVGRPLAELIIPPQHREAHHDGFSRFVQTGAGRVVNRRTEITGWHRDGYEIPVELSISAVATPQGYVANAFVRDIRERKEAQIRLEASERRLQDVLSNIPAMVGHFDRNEHCVFANELALRVHRMSREEAVGRHLQEGISEAAYELHRPHVQRVLLGHRARFEGVEVRNGRRSHYQVNLVPERDAAGEVCGFYLMTFDVSELKNVHEELERSESRLRAITDNLPVMISYIDKDHQLRFVNRTFEQWTGIPVSSALNKPLKEVLGTKLYAQREEQLARALSGERVEFEVESVALGVHRWLHTVYVPDMFAVDTVKGVYTLTSDVTALRMAERRMADLALSDPLTGLANRRRFDERLPEALARARRDNSGVAVMFLDVDHFKVVNDTFGHASGDAVLKGFGARLAASVRITDFVARLAGDEFVVILEGVRTIQECQAVADKISAAARVPVRSDGEDLSVTASIGIAYLQAGRTCDAAVLLKLADAALYETKKRGRNGYTCAPEEATPSEPL